MIADPIEVVHAAVDDTNNISDLSIFETKEIDGLLNIKEVPTFEPPGAVVYDYVVGQFYQARDSVAKVPRMHAIDILHFIFIFVFSTSMFRTGSLDC